MPDGNGNGTSGGTGEETDWGGLIEDVGGLVDELFDGDFWDWISGFGCMTSDFKLRYLKDRFPAAINAMRSKSGVDSGMTPERVNEFTKRLAHHYADINANPGGEGSCRGTYSRKYLEMLQTYMTELYALLQTSGFRVSDYKHTNPPLPVGFRVVENFNQADITVNDGYGFQGNRGFAYKEFVVDESYSGGNYTTIDDPEYDGGGIFGGGTFSPTMSSMNVMNYALGGLLLFGFYKYAKDNKMLK